MPLAAPGGKHDMPSGMRVVNRTGLINSLSQHFAKPPKLGKSTPMKESRIDKAVARLDTALARIAEARDTAASKSADAASSARVMALVNSHEKLREEVADTLNELDTLIEELEG